jgi:hypothetical protein
LYEIGRFDQPDLSNLTDLKWDISTRPYRSKSHTPPFPLRAQAARLNAQEATMPGPVPKRSEERRRRNQEPGGIARTPTSTRPLAPTDWIADATWHPLAADWFLSLYQSGQAIYYERSDLATARYVAEAMSRNLNAHKFSPMLFTAVMQASTNLLATEGDRRRLRIELERVMVDDGAAEAKVSRMAQYRKSAAG